MPPQVNSTWSRWVLAIACSSPVLVAIAARPAKSTPAEPAAALAQRAAELVGVQRCSLQPLHFNHDSDDHVRTVVELNGQALTLDLVRHSLRADDFQVLVQSEADGPLVPHPAPPVLTFRGTIVELDDAEVRATYAAGNLTATVYAPDGLYGIQPLQALDPTAAPALHIVYRDNDRLATDGQCGVTHDGAAPPAVIGGSSRSASGSGLEIAEIGLDADFDFYQANGSSVFNTVQDMENIINGVEPVYEVAEISVTYEITTCIVRLTTQPYTTTNPNSLLGQFNNTWSTAPESFIRRDVAHLFTGKNIDGSTIGIASVAVICGSNAYGLSQSRWTTSFTGRVGLTAHELGHNWAALHCNGTSNCRIMCSGLGGCNGLSPLTFGPSALDDIVPFVASRSCLFDLAPPLQLPFCEDFEGNVADPANWSYNDGGFISTGGINEPSGIRSLVIDTDGSGLYRNDEIRTNFINLIGNINVPVSYRTQHRGVEAGEQLVVEYWSNARNWVELNRVTSDGIDQTAYDFHDDTLPGNAVHSEFRLRFRTEGDDPGDDWYIDDVLIDCVLCNEPCSDDDVCTLNDVCMGSICQGTPVDCTATSTDCTAASCDSAGGAPNCDTLLAINDLQSCNGGAGQCYAGACREIGDARLFMVAGGAESGAPTSGATQLTLPAGGTATVEVWLADTAPLAVGGYQVSLPGTATPLAGASGTVTYVDDGGPAGGSVAIDTADPDWLFSGEDGVVTFLSETGLPTGFAMIAVAPIGVGLSIDGLAYAGTFQITASADALGPFTLGILPDGAPPNGGTALTDDSGVGPVPVLQQPLTITVVEAGDCEVVEDCADTDGNTIIDDVCSWYDCQPGGCVIQPRTVGDAGGAFGACPVDGFANVHDRNHALTCFAGTNTCAAINIDIGGPFGSCAADGFCNVHDANLALAAFAGTTTCTCPGGPAPEWPPAVVGVTAIDLSAPRTAAPGEAFAVQVSARDPLALLQSYQLHLAVGGGRSGQLILEAITLESRADAAFADGPQRFSAVNVTTAQMLAGLDHGGTSTAAHAYLATYHYRPSSDARGRFVVDLAGGDQTVLIGGPQAMIALEGGRPAVVDVDPRNSRSKGRAR